MFESIMFWLLATLRLQHGLADLLLVSPLVSDLDILVVYRHQLIATGCSFRIPLYFCWLHDSNERTTLISQTLSIDA